MVNPTTKTADKNPTRPTQAEPVKAPERVSKRKVAVSALEEATEIQAEAVEMSQATAKGAAPATKKLKRTKKEKVVRDSFRMPRSDYEKIAALKQKCADNGISVKKSELFRAGILLLASASDIQLAAADGSS